MVNLRLIACHTQELQGHYLLFTMYRAVFDPGQTLIRLYKDITSDIREFFSGSFPLH